MGDQQELFPSGLTRSQLERLSQCGSAAESADVHDLLATAREHLHRTQSAHALNRMINVRLAAAIVSLLEKLVSHWGSLAPNQAFWVKGAMHYFATSNDDEPDFQSPLGFEDDAEILNACLKFIGRNDLRLNAEDYDNA